MLSDDDEIDHHALNHAAHTILIEKEIRQKHASRKIGTDKDALLSDGTEVDDEDYTDIFEDKKVSSFVDSVNFEEGDSVSASDNEISGYSGNTDTYIDKSDIISIDKRTLDVSNPKEGRLIDLGSSPTSPEVEDEPILDEQVITAGDRDLAFKPKIPLDDHNINGIAEKLCEDIAARALVDRRQTDNDSLSDFNADDEQEENLSSLTNGYHSTDNEVDKISIVKKSVLNYSGSEGGESGNMSNVSHESTHHLPDNIEAFFNKSRSVSESSINENNVQKNKDNKKWKRTRSTRQTRHRIYLDDPDIHQLILHHSTLLRSEKKRATFEPPAQDTSNNLESQGGLQFASESVPDIKGMPDVDFAVRKSFSTEGRAKSLSYLGPYERHPPGSHTSAKMMVARIRDKKRLSSSSTSEEDDDEYTNRQMKSRITKSDSMRNLHRSNSNEVYEKCPDCGERHPPDPTQAAAEEICPDCGVPHNPYHHSPSHREVEERKLLDTLPSIDGPHTLDELTKGTRYSMKYLGSSQIITKHPVTKETRMQQAQDAYNRIKGDEDDPSTTIDMLISLERIQILNKETKFEDIMMDHALRTVCFICDMGSILVLMARKLTSEHSTDMSIERGEPVTLANIVAEREKKTSKNICHVFDCENAAQVAKAIGQAFNVAYRHFLQTNGIAHDHVEEAEYCHVLESQKIVGQDLDKLTDNSSSRDVVISKRRGEYLGLMLLESGWGSMLPTVFVAHIANYSPAALCQQLCVGDHILSCNGASLVGLPLSECNNTLKNARSSARVVLKVVSCPPVVDVVVSRPDTKFQLGFSVQNGTICSLLRGGIAERGGIRVGHRIIEINGDSVVAKSHQSIVDTLANTVGSISMKTMPVAMYRLMVGEDQPTHF